MICPKCRSKKIQVIDSRDVDDRTIRRRRECEKCSFRFTAYERIEPTRISVIKTDGKTEPFDRGKIIRGVEIASNGRIEIEKIKVLADEIESKLSEDNEAIVSSKKIGNMVIKKLKKIDEISYIRFASVYKNFQDLDSFEEELEKLKK